MDEKNLTRVIQLHTPTTLLGSNTGSFLIFAVVFTAIFQVYGKWAKKRKRKGKKLGPVDADLPGPEALPGPKTWDPTGILGHLVELLPFEKTLHTGLQWGKEYGDVVKVSGLCRTWVVLNSGPLVQTLLKSSDMGQLIKAPEIYDRLKPYVDNGVLVSKGKFWQHERKILLKSMSYQSLKAYMGLLNKHCKTFVSSLDDMFSDGKPHEVNGLINSSFIRVIAEMITGFDNEQSEEHDQYHHNFQIWKEGFSKRVLQPWLLIKPMWKLTAFSKKYDQAVEEMFEFARRRIKEHKENREEIEAHRAAGVDEKCIKQPPFRTVLDELVDGGVDPVQIVDEINTMMFGGHETGATAIHFFLLCMALNPDIQKECQEEIDELFEDPINYKNGEISYDAVLSGLKFVERCIMETLRMFPPIFIYLRRLNTPLKINYNGQDYMLPVGTNCAVVPWLLHRKEEYYPEPDKFNPDRFLPEETAKRHAYAFVPFSAGPRNCLGMKFAMIEMKTIAAYTLRHFSLTTTDKIADIPIMPYLTLTPSKDYTFQFTRRDIRNPE